MKEAVSSTFLFSMVFFDKLYDFAEYLVHFESISHPALWNISYAFLLSIRAIAKFFHLVLLSLKMYWSMYRIIIIIIHSLELFTSALGDGFSLESEGQQVSSSLQDSSQDSGSSQ